MWYSYLQYDVLGTAISLNFSEHGSLNFFNNKSTYFSNTFSHIIEGSQSIPFC